MPYSPRRIVSLLLPLRAAGVLLALFGGSVVQAADYYWFGADNRIGGTNTWYTNGNRQYWVAPSGSRYAWDNNWIDARAIFYGTVGAPYVVTVDGNTTIEVNALWFRSNGYTLAAENSSSAINLVGTTPTITVNNAISAILDVKLTGSSAKLTGGGTLKLGQSELIANTMALTIDGGSTLDFQNHSETLGAVLLKDGRIGASENESGHLSAASLEVQSGAISVALDGNGGLRKTTSGTVYLEGNQSSTYSGETRIEAGTLYNTKDRQLSGNSALVVAGGTLNLGGYDQNVKALRLDGGNIVSNGKILVDGGNSAAVLLSGTISSRLESYGLAKSGFGTATLTGGLDLRNGAITVDGGLLDLTGASWVNNPGHVTVTSGVFAASGTYNNVTLTLNGGAVAPGGDSAVGSLTFTGSPSSWSSGGGYDFNIWNATGSAGSGWDLLTVKTLNLGSGSLDLNVIGLVSASGGLGDIANFVNSAGTSYSWTFLTAQDGINGFNSAQFNIDLSGFTNDWSGGSFSVTKVGNNLNLVFTPVPEPQTYAILLGCGALGLAGYRRWRRRHA